MNDLKKNIYCIEATGISGLSFFFGKESKSNIPVITNFEDCYKMNLTELNKFVSRALNYQMFIMGSIISFRIIKIDN